MTWTAHATVTKVDGTDPVTVTAKAELDGVIGAVILYLVFDGENAPLDVGDLVQVTGHFTTRKPAEQDSPA